MSREGSLPHARIGLVLYVCGYAATWLEKWTSPRQGMRY